MRQSRSLLILGLVTLAGCTVQEALDRTVNRPRRQATETPPPLPQKIIKENAPLAPATLEALFRDAQMILDAICTQVEDLPGWPQEKRGKDATTVFTRRRLTFRVRAVHRGSFRGETFELVDQDFAVQVPGGRKDYFYQVLTAETMRAAPDAPLYKYALFFREDRLESPDLAIVRVPVQQAGVDGPDKKPLVNEPRFGLEFPATPGTR